jgi:hypothetical protein
MGYAVGILLALFVCLFARGVGFDRDRALYPTVLMVIASYYVLFAVMGGSTHALTLESVAMSAFVLIAVAGFKRNPRLVVAALGAHGVFDFFHVRLVNNPGVPAWWPAFCLSFNVSMAAFLAWSREWKPVAGRASSSI